MGRPHLHVDWPEAVAKAADADGEWVLIAGDVPYSTVRTVKERQNLPLRNAGRMDARMLETYGTPPRGDLWMRSLDDWKPPRVVGDSMFRTLRLPKTLKEQLFRYARKQELSVSALVDRCLIRIGRRGRINEDPEGAKLALNTSTRAWNAAMARAEADGFTLADALRDEIRHEIRRRS